MARSDQPDEPTGPLAKVPRLRRARELILEQLRERRPICKADVANAIAAEFDVAVRTGYGDFDAVWSELKFTHEAEIHEVHQLIVEALGDRVWWLVELLEQYNDAKAAAAAGCAKSRTLAHKIWVQIGKEMKHSEPETKVEVNVMLDALVMNPAQRQARIEQLRRRLPAPVTTKAAVDDGDN